MEPFSILLRGRSPSSRSRTVPSLRRRACKSSSRNALSIMRLHRDVRAIARVYTAATSAPLRSEALRKARVLASTCIRGARVISRGVSRPRLIITSPFAMQADRPHVRLCVDGRTMAALARMLGEHRQLSESARFNCDISPPPPVEDSISKSLLLPLSGS